MKVLVGATVLVLLVAVAATVMSSNRAKQDLVKATAKMKSLGDAFRSYANDSGGVLPLEDAPGRDDWLVARSPEAAEAWYNVLPKQLGARAVGELADSPAEFYSETYPLFIPGAPYPKDEKKFKKPYFAVGMNSRLQRKNDDGTKARGTYAEIVNPGNTVVLLERGLPDDKKVSKIQKGFDAGAKANPEAFAARHNQKGLLTFADGHTEVVALSDLVDKSGRIIVPQERFIWTSDPDEDPN